MSAGGDAKLRCSWIAKHSLSIPSQKLGESRLGVTVDDRGRLVSFKHVLTVPPEAAGQDRKVVWHQQLQLIRLYQVRVALRERSGDRKRNAVD
jgi:hypothetical protein